MSDEQARADDAWERARGQRADLHAAVVDLEAALAAPAPGRVSAWAGRVHEALVEMGATFERHIAFTERPGGLFDEVGHDAPRLTHKVGALRGEHERLRREIADMLSATRALARDGGDGPAAELREAATGLLSRLSRHRQHGADLVYEAYNLDIGAGD